MVQTAGMSDLFSDSNLLATIFLPTDAAFDKLVRDLGLTPAQFLDFGPDRLKEVGGTSVTCGWGLQQPAAP